jgi:quinoprotein glucose dehydrogenase
MSSILHPGAAILMIALASVTDGRALAANPQDEWRAYGRTALGDRHSPLAQINSRNVNRLTVAWRFHTGEIGKAYQTRRPPRLSATPIMISGRLYFATPFGRVIALDALSGKAIWRFDAKVDRSAGFGDFTNRGVAYWRDARGSSRRACAERIPRTMHQSTSSPLLPQLLGTRSWSAPPSPTITA